MNLSFGKWAVAPFPDLIPATPALQARCVAFVGSVVPRTVVVWWLVTVVLAMECCGWEVTWQETLDVFSKLSCHMTHM